MLDSLYALRGNAHFEAFLGALDYETGYGRTVFQPEPYQTAFANGRQSVSNDIKQHLKTIELKDK